MVKIAISKNNPILNQSLKQQNLDEARVIFINRLNNFAERINLSEKEVIILKTLINDVYLEKKVQYMLENKLSDLSGRVENAIEELQSNRPDRNFKAKRNFTKVFYSRNRKRSEFAYD